MSEEIRIFGENDGATYRTDIKGWVSSDGRYYGADEQLARMAGATHTKCGCGSITKLPWVSCANCIALRRYTQWLAMPEAEWDGETPLWSSALEEFCLDSDDLWEAVEEHGDDLDLVICEPVKLRHLDANYWEDDLCHDDGYADLPEAVQRAIEALNRAIDEARPVNWRPGKQRVATPKPDDAGG